jgi:FlaA1/EpsC-like NDP-sugar epimerase
MQLALDLTVAGACFIAAYLIRFDGMPDGIELKQMVFLLPYVVLARMVSNHIFGVYRIAWRYVGMRDIRTFVVAAAAPSMVFLVLRLALPPLYHYGMIPLGIIAIDLLLASLGLLGVRVGRRFIFEAHQAKRSGGLARKPVLLIGAGRAGIIVAREIRTRPELGMAIVGFIDDDPIRKGNLVDGLPILGATHDLPVLCKQHGVDQVVITIASATGADMRRIVGICESIPVRTQIVPGIYELVDGTVRVNRIRDVDLEDLLGRSPAVLDMDAIAGFIRGNQILVTGAGGSIGSEMCRQVCRFEPAALILLDRYENNLFDIDRELAEAYPNVRRVPCVADIADQARMASIFAEHAPRVVIHAAAHKHVPMMEQNAGEAVKNNVFGTKTVADLAARHGASVFVLISTDKAVNPTSVMGATKRAAELYLQSLARRSRTRFIAVRFGNVLGSVGSVIPIFKQQIARGGPVTVTHPEMKRYFMTIPEAAQLVLEAASMGQGGEIYVLDMGEPLRVLTLAEDLIRLSGLKPYDDVDIVFSGVRPGEKLFEEIAFDDENLDKTKHPKIYVGRFQSFPQAQVASMMRALAPLTDDHDVETVRAALFQALAGAPGSGAAALPTVLQVSEPTSPVTT